MLLKMLRVRHASTTCTFFSFIDAFGRTVLEFNSYWFKGGEIDR